MNIIEFKDQLLFLVSQMMGTTLPRAFSVLCGLLLLCRLFSKVWCCRRIHGFQFWSGVAGGGLIAIGLNPSWLHVFVRVADPLRARLLIGGISFAVITITIEAIRRSVLRERYALLWLFTGIVILASAFFPELIGFIGGLLGTDDYGLIVLGILGSFIVLIAFHFSLAFSKGEGRQHALAQRCAELESRLERLEAEGAANGKARTPVPVVVLGKEEPYSKRGIPFRLPQVFRVLGGWRGSGGFVLVIICMMASWAGSLVTGIMSGTPMIGDEVTHFYMLANQAQALPEPVYTAPIPMASGAVEVRTYPHVNGWHYIGAVLYRVSGERLWVVQLYQSLFWLQFLVMAMALAYRWYGRKSLVSCVYVVSLASIPVLGLLSVVFYQDLPALAQIMTAFWLLSGGHVLLATLFLILAFSIKVNAFLLIPAFFAYSLFVLFWQKKDGHGYVRKWIVLGVSVLIMVAASWFWQHTLQSQVNSDFYPVVTAKMNWNRLVKSFRESNQALEQMPNSQPPVEPVKRSLIVTPYEKEIIANHPGDLRLFKNYLVYGGGLFWLVVLLGVVGGVIHLCRTCSLRGYYPALCLTGIGLSYILPTAYLLRTAPDARFFVLGLPFLLLPICSGVCRLPRLNLFLYAMVALAIWQSGHVYSKTYHLRSLSADTRDAIEFLRENPPSTKRIFMYPEGNYRFFPVEHEWYMNYWLRDFWKGDNDVRITLLHRHHIGAIVIKKYLVDKVDDEIVNLGVYPDYFVQQVLADPRFRNVFENDQFVIFMVPDVVVSSLPVTDSRDGSE